jgi:hypothetical protein
VKVAKPVNRQQLVNAIAQAESSGPLTNRQALYALACEAYNIAAGASNPKLWITPSIVLLRVKEWNLAVSTPVGKRGRQPGSTIPRKLDEHGNPIPRAQRKGRRASKTNMGAMRAGEFRGEQYQGLLTRIENGSLTARIKANCLACAGFVTAEVANCGCTGCPLWDVRPFQSPKGLEAAAPENVVSGLDVPKQLEYSLAIVSNN